MFGIEFQQPSRLWWLLGAVAALAGFLYLRSSLAPAVEKRLTTLDLLEQAEREVGTPWRRWVPVTLAVLVLAAMFAQWAEPVATAEVRRPARIVLAVDNSLSTRAIDEEGGSTRLERIQAEALEIVESAQPGDELALVTFADEAILSLPSTVDSARMVDIISGLEPEVETDLGGALIEAHRLTRAAAEASHVIVLSDGAAGGVDLALEQLSADGVAVSTVLVGTTGGFIMDDGFRRPFPANPATMERIAEATGGTFLTEDDTESVMDSVYGSLNRNELNFETVTKPVQWFLLLALVLAVLTALAHLRIYRTRWAT